MCIDKETDVENFSDFKVKKNKGKESERGTRVREEARKSDRTNDLKQSNLTQRATVEFVKEEKTNSVLLFLCFQL